MRALLLVALFCGPAPAYASPQQGIEPLTGYSCMTVNLPPGRLAWDQLPRARTAPTVDAPYAAGTVGQTVLAPNPLVVRNAYAEVLLFNGQQAWLPLKQIAGVNRQCRAMRMSDGKPGIG